MKDLAALLFAGLWLWAVPIIAALNGAEQFAVGWLLGALPALSVAFSD